MSVKVKNVCFSNEKRFSLITGPCQMESRNHAFDLCGKLKEITNELKIDFVYKSSFDKANRTSIKGKRGLGIDKSLSIFEDLKKEFNVPVITDIHNETQCDEVKDCVDMLQIPAFLCRQTDLLIAAAKTGLAINIKKGQFLAPWDMGTVVEKVTSSGNDRVLICDRGTSFGYNTLVSDFRGLPIMQKITNKPVIFDATHSVQQPGGKGTSSGGQREFVPYLAKAAVAVGVAGLFIETHENPDNAPSDGPNMINITDMKKLLETLIKIDKITKENN